MRDDMTPRVAHERRQTYRRKARDARRTRRVVVQPAPRCPYTDDLSASGSIRTLWGAISTRLAHLVAHLAGTPVVSRCGRPACDCGPGAVF
jgi:hypothetical protein